MTRRLVLVLLLIAAPSWAAERALLLFSIAVLRPDYVLQADATA